MDSAPYLNTLSTRLGSTLGSPQNQVLRHPSRQPIRIEHGKTHQLRQPIRIEYYVTRVVSQSESSTEKTHQLRQPIRIEYYVTRVVSQSESSITSPESCITPPESSRLGWRSLLGSRLESARYSLSYYIGTSNPHPLWSAHYSTTHKFFWIFLWKS